MESTVELGEPLRRSLRLSWDPDLAKALLAQVDALAKERPVMVTQLADPRSAYYRIRHPIPASPETEERLERGRRRHEEIERRLAPPERCEVRVAREGIVGRIDLVTDRPTELKTTSAAVPREHLLADRAGYFEQLGMYCALADQPDGRLLVVADPPAGGGPEIEAVDCRFSDLPGLRARMGEAAARFREALARNDPTALPRCPWYDRGCGYRQAGVCTCTGGEATESLAVARHLERSESNEDLIAEVRDRLASAPVEPPETRSRGYRELVYLRRGYFERTRPEVERPPPPGTEEGGGPSLYQLMREAVESRNPPGLYLATSAEHAPEERVLRLHDEPVLIKTSRALGPPRIEEFPTRHPWYFLELGLRCAALGRGSGWLVIGYDRLRPWEGPVRVLKVQFDPLLAWRGELDARQRRLAAAWAAGSPAGLPACPDWMFEGCPYQPGCGEGELPACRRIR